MLSAASLNSPPQAWEMEEGVLSPSVVSLRLSRAEHFAMNSKGFNLRERD
jgi:hypothetical protein